MTTPATLDPERETHRALLAIVERSHGAPLGEAPRLDATFDALGLDELSRAHAAAAIEGRFHVHLPPLAGLTLADALALVETRTYWTYDAPPTGRAIDLARGDFFPRLARPPLHLLFRGAMRALWRYRVENRRAIPKRGPFVLVANHAGHPDTPALMAALPLRRVNDTHPLAAADYFFRRKLVGGAVHLLLNALPIERKGTDAESAMRDGMALLREGHGVILFPEGTRSQTGEIAPFKKGVGLLLAGKEVPAIPASIHGSRDVLPKGATRPKLKPLRVRLGDPVRYHDVPDDREGWKRVAADLEARVRELAARG